MTSGERRRRTDAAAELRARPTVGVGAAGKAVAEDLSALVKAEIALAKAELVRGREGQGHGRRRFGGRRPSWAGWALQGLLITAGLRAGAGCPRLGGGADRDGACCLLVAGIAAMVGKSKMATPVSLDTTKAKVEEDVAWTKSHLKR